MKLFCLDSAYTAVCYYRQGLFINRMREQDHQVIVSNFLTNEILYDTEICHIVGINPNSIDVNSVKTMQSKGIKVIMDIDDAVFNIGVWHPERDRNLLWSVTYKNHLLGMSNEVDAIFVTTNTLKNYVGTFTKKPVYIIPNCLDETLHQQTFKPQARLPTPTIAWAGGSTHIMDLDMIKEVFFTLGKDGYRFRFIGTYPPHVAGTDFVDYIEWSGEMDKYYQTLAIATPDLCIAPLQDTIFNCNKSNIKLLEYSAYCGVPIIASDIGPYHNESIVGVRLVKNSVTTWCNAIKQTLEKRDSERVYQIPNGYSLSEVYPRWMEALDTVLKGH